ncbi:hypothetical protein NQ318_016819 [Aromia moschata]|uniref:Titin-like n=1 Tax=Aromia moschata TaxID=1265417 RepID=A0AAV8YUV6_9CUCU|nr:hypothetical protein NQ318_016819 [Aromia moschata]
MDGKEEKTEIVTVEEEGKAPETTVTVEEIESPEEVVHEKPTYTVEELPEEVQVTEVVDERGKKKNKVIRKRVIKKEIDGKKEKTEIVTVEEEGKAPETTVTVESLEAPEEIAPEKPVYVVEELPEEIQVTEVVTEGGKKKKVIKKRVIKKHMDGKEEKTEILTVEEEGKAPETTVTVEEIESPEEVVHEKPTYTVEELPEEVQVTEVVDERGKKKKEVIRKRVIKKEVDGKKEKTEIVTVEEEGKAPETTVTVESLEAPEEIAPEKPVYVVEELPEEIQVTEVVTEGGKKKKKVIKKRIIKKHVDGKEEKTEILTVEEEGKAPETTVTVEEIESPEEVVHERPTYTVEELPEEVQVTEVVDERGKNKKKKTEIVTVEEEGKAPETTVTVESLEVPEEIAPEKPVYVVEELPEEIQQVDGKQEKTEILTVEEEGKAPETTVTVEEIESPEEVVHEKPTYTVEELPEEVQVTEVVDERGKKKKKVIRKRVIKKEVDGKKEKTEIVTVEEEGKTPETTVTVERLEAPEEIALEKPVFEVEELPEEIQVTEVVTEGGKKKKKVIKKRVIKKHVDGKQEKTEILTVEEEGKAPETTVTVEEIESPEEVVHEKPTYTVEELPEEVQVTEKTEIVTVEEEGKTPETTVTVERLEAPEEIALEKPVFEVEELPEEIQHVDGKQEKTEILTVEEEGKAPETIVTVEEIDTPEEIAPEKPVYIAEELPEEVQVLEVIDERGKKKKRVIRKRVIKKEVGGKKEKTEIVTVEEEGKAPETTVTVESLEAPEEIAPEKPVYVVEELPEEIQQVGGKQEKTEILTVEEEGKAPETTVTVEENESPEEIAPEKPVYIAEELPEEVQVTEVVDERGKKKKKVIRKRVIKKEVDGKKEKTEIVTVEEEGKAPETTVTVERLETPEEIAPEKPVIAVEELPEEIQVTEVVTEGGKKKKKVIKKRVIKKHVEGKQEKTEILTVEEEGKAPETTVTVEEIDTPEEIAPEKPVYIAEELPEEVQVLEVVDERGKKKMREKTEIVTVEEEGKVPETTVTVESLEAPEEIAPEKPVYVVEELPEEIQVTEVVTEGGKKKKVIKKRVIKKQVGGKQEKTEILTVEEEGKAPETTVTVEENESPEEIAPEKIVYIAEELPEEVQVSEVIDERGNKKKRVTRKRVIKKEVDGKKGENGNCHCRGGRQITENNCNRGEI